MKGTLLSLIGALLFCAPNPRVMAQVTSYTQTNLVGNTSGSANNTDALLVNPWGIAFFPGAPFWIADHLTGVATQYDATGFKLGLAVPIPSAANHPCSPGCPTGNVANSTASFGGGIFIFDTEDGIVASWTGGATAVTVFDNSASASGAVYKGLALITNTSGDFLLAANFRSGKIDVLDTNFNPATLAGSFTDPGLPAGFAPHGVHAINGLVYVAYALQDSPKHDAVPGAGTGVIDVFDLNGNFVQTLIPNGTARINAPFGVAIAPSTFGTFGNDILVGNFGDGTISAFDPSSGASRGQLVDGNDNVISNANLWDMVFGAGGTGDPNTLYLTAGLLADDNGLFASLTPGATVSGPIFSLSSSMQYLTLTRGSSGALTVSAAGKGGFIGLITLSCTAPTGVTCSLSPASIAQEGTSTLTVTASSSASSKGLTSMGMLMLLPFAFGFLACGMATQKRSVPEALRRIRWIIGMGVVLLAMGLAGCGSATTTTPLTIIGTSGSLTQTVSVNLEIE